MTRILPLLLFLCLESFGNDIPKEQSNDNTEGPQNTVIKKVAGTSFLVAEFVGLPVLDWRMNWGNSLKLQNPFDHIRETEPYIQDKLWHFVGASATTKLNYEILRRFFDVDDPLLAAGILSFLNWTMMEFLDGMAGSGFSLRDQAGNTLGVGFGMLTLAYPDFPLHVRIGVKSWSHMFDVAKKAHSSGNSSAVISERYTFMKVEMIYMHWTSLHGGIAVTTTDDAKDLYGITAGLDIVKWLNSRKDGWWNGSLDYFSDHFSTVVSVTFWLD